MYKYVYTKQNHFKYEIEMLENAKNSNTVWRPEILYSWLIHLYKCQFDNHGKSTTTKRKGNIKNRVGIIDIQRSGIHRYENL